MQPHHFAGSNISNTGDINVLDVGGREVFTAAPSAVFLCTPPAIKSNCLKKCLREAQTSIKFVLSVVWPGYSFEKAAFF